MPVEGSALPQASFPSPSRIAQSPAAKFQFPILSHDLREEEALHAALDSISQLSGELSSITVVSRLLALFQTAGGLTTSLVVLRLQT